MERERELHATVQLSIAALQPWIEAGGSRPTFFPDYTDHSLKHAEAVLATATSLVREESWRALTAADAAVLVLGTLLHDAAMHLSREGFEALLQPHSAWQPLDGFGDRPWPLLWADFCAEARRFDHRKLVEVFGTPDPVEIPDSGNLRLDARARRLVGEFLRRHHARLAHEIARHGVPGTNRDPLRLAVGPAVADLSGLVARSHGLPLRSVLPYLKRNFSNRVAPAGVHAVFLMALLRVSDYLQIQADRAPWQTHRVHRIQSPVSAVEWQVHESVQDVRESEEDPEAVFVVTAPGDIRSYLRIEEWLAGLQKELDASWAVLGEVYGRQRNLAKLGLTVRRILSNLGGEADFPSQIAFYPRHVAFTTAGADLLKLLIGPLYGNDPAVGVRELVQNAVDAVRELGALVDRGLVPRPLDLPDQEADVVVALEEDAAGDAWLTVADRGIGMTPSIVSGYFRKAGASFRGSDAWKANFHDEQGRSTVLRAGRFGIGALSEFLLGNEIHVSTRHATAPPEAGLSFSATLDTDTIELRAHTRPVGTSVRIRLRPSAAKSLRFDYRGPGVTWDWFCLEEPSVVRRMAGEPLFQRYRLPACGSHLPLGWRRIHAPGFADVQWTLTKQSPTLACNGLALGNRGGHETIHWLWEPGATEDTFTVPVPSCSVFDPDGNLPLTLARDDLRDTLPFRDELLDDVLRDLLATALLLAPTAPPPWHQEHEWSWGWPPYQGTTSGNRRASWCCTKDGIAPVQAHNLWRLDADTVLIPVHTGVTPASAPHERDTDQFLSPGTVMIPFRGRAKLFDVFESLTGGFISPNREPARLKLPAVHGAYRLKSAAIIFDRPLDRLLDWASLLDERSTAGIRIEWKRRDEQVILFLMREGMSSREAEEMERIALQSARSGVPVVIWRTERRPRPPEPSRLSRAWNEIIEAPVIPFGPDERRRVLAGAYARLQAYIQRQEEEAVAGIWSRAEREDENDWE